MPAIADATRNATHPPGPSRRKPSMATLGENYLTRPRAAAVSMTAQQVISRQRRRRASYSRSEAQRPLLTVAMRDRQERETRSAAAAAARLYIQALRPGQPSCKYHSESVATAMTSIA